MRDIRSFLHNADNRSTPPALVSRHNTQPLLSVEASNAVTDWHPHCAQSESLSSSRSSSSSLPNNSSDDDDDTPLEVNREAEVEITPCPRAVVSVCRTIILTTNVTSVSLDC